MLIFSSLFGDCQSFSDFTSEQLHDDVDALFQIIEEVHPNGKALNNQTREEFKSNLTSSYYSESDAFFIFNGLLKKLNDGHSSVKFSSRRSKELIKYGAFFPYELEFFDSTAVVIGHINEIQTDAIGREIFKINNIPVKQILEDLTVVVMMDGEKNESASEWLSDDFWFYFTLYNGFRSSYSITYIQDDKEIHEIAKARPRMSSLKTGILEDFRSEPIQLNYSEGIPILSVSGFNQKSKKWWKRKVKDIFAELNKGNHQSLILDLRNNGGGQEGLQDVLLEAFGIDTKEKYQEELLKDIDYSKIEGINNKLFERFKSFGLKKFEFPVESSDNFRSRKSKTCDKTCQPLFRGDLYVLVDGTTFSCGSDAAAILKDSYSNTLLVGTETRGSGKVNYAGYFIHVTLPNTGLVIRIPRVKYILNTQEFSEDSGVHPDLHVEMTKSDVKNGIDTQLNFLIKAILEESLYSKALLFQK